MKKIMNWLLKHTTDQYTHIPILWVNFNLKKFRKDGAKDSCMIHVLPELRNDEKLMNMTKEMIDYIRNNYDMEKVVLF